MSASVLLTGCGAVESVIENEQFATQRVNIFDEFDLHGQREFAYVPRYIIYTFTHFIIALEAFMEAM
jgi:hypothetical protein